MPWHLLFLPVILTFSLSPLTSLLKRPPAGDPAEKVWLQLVSGGRQAGRPGVAGQHGGGRPVQLQQSQVVVVAVVVVVVVKMDPLNSSHLFSGAAPVQEELAQVDRP